MGILKGVSGWGGERGGKMWGEGDRGVESYPRPGHRAGRWTTAGRHAGRA